MTTRIEAEDYQVLADISSAIARVRDKVDLLRIILQQIKPLFGHNDSALMVLDAEQQFFQDWAVVLPGIDDSPGTAYFHQHLDELYQADGVAYPSSIIEHKLNQIEQTGGPGQLDFRQDQAFSDVHSLTVLRELGYVEGIIGRMQVRDRLLGAFIINTKQAGSLPPRQYALFNAVTDLVAVAVANILAHEEILAQDREKALLLALSTDMATVRERDSLWEVMVAKIRPLVAFDEAVIVTIDDTEQTYWHFLTTASGEPRANANFQQLDVKAMPLASSPFAQFCVHPDAVNPWQVADWLARFPTHPDLLLMRQIGMQQSVALQLRWADKVRGILFFHYRQNKSLAISKPDLYQIIANQVAATLANILANEEILRREKEKSLHLALAQVLTDEATWPARLAKASPLLQMAIPFQLLLAYVEHSSDQSDACGYYRTGSEEYQTLSTDDLQGITQLPADQFGEQLRTLALAGTQPMRRSGPELTSHNKKHPFSQALTHHFRWQASLSFPVTPARFGRVVFLFYHSQPEAYTDAHLSALRQLQPTLTTVFDKLLAFEEVERLSEQLRQDNAYLREEVQVVHNHEAIVGTSASLQAVFHQVDQVAATDTTVLIQGETGTGKELIARALHNQSTRKGRVLIKLNCATLPAQLIESELFGHEKGAFTGAIEKRIGKFELADGGTIFLDEIGELPLELQAKLLRVLQEREFERLGGKTLLKTNIRVIAATNRDLSQEVIEGRFRADLFYRLSVFPISLPPLRERPEDVALLATHYGQKFSRQMNRPFRGIQEESMRELLHYDWPGNVRELENLLEQAVILSNGAPLSWGRPLVPATTKAHGARLLTGPAPLPAAEADSDAIQRERIFAVFRQTKGKILGPDGAAQLLKMRPALLEVWERAFILAVLEESRGRVRGAGGAAELIGLHPNTLDNRMIKLGISREHVAK